MNFQNNIKLKAQYFPLWFSIERKKTEFSGFNNNTCSLLSIPNDSHTLTSCLVPSWTQSHSSVWKLKESEPGHASCSLLLILAEQRLAFHRHRNKHPDTCICNLTWKRPSRWGHSYYQVFSAYLKLTLKILTELQDYPHLHCQDGDWGQWTRRCWVHICTNT